jgi:hypothetical protein
MSVQLDRAIAQTGTRFRIFPQPRFLLNADGSGWLFAPTARFLLIKLQHPGGLTRISF